jgi:hypothetical protein
MIYHAVWEEHNIYARDPKWKSVSRTEVEGKEGRRCSTTKYRENKKLVSRRE